MRRLIRTLIGVAAAMMLMVGPAGAATEGWVPANTGTTVDGGIITLDTTNEAGTPAGTSLEIDDLDRDVEEGDVISFDYRFVSDDTTCGGGQPRVFVQIDEAYENTFDNNPDKCGSDTDGDGWFTVEYTIVNTGTVGHAGVVFDNPSDRGVVQVRKVIIDEPILPSSKNECKKGGWADAGYRNQGQCVSSLARAK